ncbi:MAG TPA: nuclear transport factor 2 family protein [Chitinophagaceae bacterium]|nr:nuclear transport factor 2 family protein [Chitinophagaceae bacterium]
MTITEIAHAFSNGEFEKIFPYLDDSIIWTVVEDDEFKGKEAVIEQCKQVSQYSNAVTTRFETLYTITEGNKVAVNGTAEFYRDNKRVSFVSACDLYEFDENNKLSRITSYCIQKNE